MTTNLAVEHKLRGCAVLMAERELYDRRTEYAYLNDQYRVLFENMLQLASETANNAIGSDRTESIINEAYEFVEGTK